MMRRKVDSRWMGAEHAIGCQRRHSTLTLAQSVSDSGIDETTYTMVMARDAHRRSGIQSVGSIRYMSTWRG